MSKDQKNYFKRHDGLTEIFPAYPENIKRHETVEETLGHDIPFSNKENDSLFCIQDVIAVCHPQDPTLVKGMIAFEIRPESWTLVYVPTEELHGLSYTQDDDGTMLEEFDFLYLPIETIHSSFRGYVTDIMKSCVQYMNDHPNLSGEVIDSIEVTIQELNQSYTTDFTVDVYIPPKLCDLTGERYFRPGGELYSCFDNPRYDEDFDVPASLKVFLHTIIVEDLKNHDLRLMCDDYLRAEKAIEAQERQRNELSLSLQRLTDKFKLYQCPHTKQRSAMRPQEKPFIPEKRHAMRPFIIPKHWHYDY